MVTQALNQSGTIGLCENEVNPMRLSIEVEQEEDGRWLSEVIELPGVLAYGQTRAEAIIRAHRPGPAGDGGPDRARRAAAPGGRRAAAGLLGGRMTEAA